jgi:hypothetical protein
MNGFLVAAGACNLKNTPVPLLGDISSCHFGGKYEKGGKRRKIYKEREGGGKKKRKLEKGKYKFKMGAK